MKTIAMIFVSFAAGYAVADKKEVDPTYGPTGLPKNCIAIVQENVDMFRKGRANPIDTIDAIERHCGKYGYSINE